MPIRNPWGLWLVLSAVGCGSSQPTPPPPASAPATMSAPVPERPPVPPRLAVLSDTVFADEQRVDSLSPERPLQSAPLIETLQRRAGTSSEPYSLEFDPRATAAQLYAVVQSAAAAGHPRAELTALEGRVILHAIVAPDKTSSKPATQLSYPARVMVFTTHGSQVLVQVHAIGNEPSPQRVATVAEVSSAALEENLIQALRTQAANDLLPNPLIVGMQTTDEVETLQRLLTVTADYLRVTNETPLHAQVRITPLGTLGGPPSMRLGNVQVEGQLRPFDSTAFLSNEMGTFRRCHEAALARDVGVTGHVKLLLSVTPAGKVTGVDRKDETLSDGTLSDCLGQAAAGIEVPSPNPGPGTVTVPITFAPGY